MVLEMYGKKRKFDVIIDRLATKRRCRVACGSMGYVCVMFGLQSLYFVEEGNREVRGIGYEKSIGRKWPTSDHVGRLKSCWSCRPSGDVPCDLSEKKFESAGVQAPEGEPWVVGMDVGDAPAGEDAMSPA